MARDRPHRLAFSLLVGSLIMHAGPFAASTLHAAGEYAPRSHPGSDQPAYPDLETGIWVVEPDRPGPDLPPRGRSLFDLLVTEQRGDGAAVYDIPFPFSALREKLLRQLRPGEHGEQPLKQVLIPLGRSLQRNAAAPAFFRYPRVVLAVDGEAGPLPGNPGIHMKDRLYLGYLEEPGVLEVISYNEQAGRFEFQLVKDYRAGGQPEVIYANRAVCIACHQNTTPIFSRPLWGESNADPEIAGLLKAERRDFYGIPISTGIDTPAAIDAATDRANLIPLVLFLWRSGCGEQVADEDARRCRARALRFTLQHRLTGSLAFAHDENPEWSGFAAGLEENLRRHWPEGVLVSSPDIPNRIPVSQQSPAAVSGAPLAGSGAPDKQQMNIPAAFEALQPRSPLERVGSRGAGQRLVKGLAGFVAAIDMERLDQRLFQLGSEESASHSGYRSNCQLVRKPLGEGTFRISLRCSRGQDTAMPGFDLKGRLYLRGGEIERGVIERIGLAGGTGIRDLGISEGLIEHSEEGGRIRLLLSRGTLHARLPDGNAIASLVVEWRWPVAERDAAQSAAAVVAELRVMRDFSLLQRAMDELLQSPDSAGGLLSGSPFQRLQLLEVLYPRLGIPLVGTCCSAAADLPPAKTDLPRSRRRGGDPAGDGGVEELTMEAGFYRYCARCHLTSERFPPNFLMGDPLQVRANLAQCAERLYLRLGMWGVPAADRPKNPMPPVLALGMLDLEEPSWQTGSELAGLQAYAHDILLRQTGRDPVLGELIGRGYENLRDCLPGAE